jgi:hypothetical protein
MVSASSFSAAPTQVPDASETRLRLYGKAETDQALLVDGTGQPFRSLADSERYVLRRCYVHELRADRFRVRLSASPATTVSAISNAALDVSFEWQPHPDDGAVSVTATDTVTRGAGS